MISIRARGDVMVQFGCMRHPPFDSLEARNELRVALNEMDGVDIPEAKLRYWPTLTHVPAPDSVLQRVALAHIDGATTAIPGIDTCRRRNVALGQLRHQPPRLRVHPIPQRTVPHIALLPPSDGPAP